MVLDIKKLTRRVWLLAIVSTLSFQVSANQLFLDSILVTETSLSIRAYTESEFDIDSVELEFVEQTYNLTAEFDYAIGQFYWIAEIDITDLPSVEFTAFFTVTDALQNSFTSESNILLNRAPKLRIEAPLTQSVARPDVPFSAVCTDDRVTAKF